MSELNDYLEGKITFEEFERRREERKAKDKVMTFKSVIVHIPCPSAVIVECDLDMLHGVVEVIWSSVCDSCCVSGAER